MKLFFLSSLLVAQAWASVDISPVNTLAQDFETAKKKLDTAEVKQRQVLSALYQINKKIKKIVTEKSDLSQRQALLGVTIKNLNQKVQELDRQSREQKTLLAERLKAIYKLGGGQSLARLLFSSSSSAEMGRNLKILGLVAQRDLDLIRNYNRDVEELRQKRKSLVLRLENLKSVEAKIAHQEKSLLREQALKNKLLDGVRKSRLFAIDKIQVLRQQSLQFNLDDVGLFDLLFKASFADQKGLLPSPIQGPIVKRFGLIKGQEHPYTLNHKGVVIGSAPGALVKAVFAGRASYIGSVPGYGKTLIIDHGDHYYTVYAQAEDIKVNLGDEISQAQVVASTGSSALENPPGLYFEIRHFSEPYDPQLWMKGL